MSENVVVTGGTGLVGRHLVGQLRHKGYQVTVLTRGPSREQDGVHYVHWDLQAPELDPSALEKAGGIIHLAGANIAVGRWTKKRKQEILDSRVRSTELLLRTVKSLKNRPGVFVSASAVGYYGAVTSERWFREEDPPGNDFLARVCQQWEASARLFESAGIRTAMLRTAIVLAPDGGALPRLAKPVRYGFAVPLGSGQQHLPWIHVDDLVAMYLKILDTESLRGVYNAAAPECPTNATFMRTLARALDRPYLPLGVPSALLRLVLGEMATSLLTGSCVSVEKARSAGSTFRFRSLEAALRNLLTFESKSSFASTVGFRSQHKRPHQQEK